MTSDQTHVIVGASLAGAKAAETLRAEGFDGRVVLVGAEEERPTSARRCRRTTCAARSGARRSMSTRRLLRRARHRAAARPHRGDPRHGERSSWSSTTASGSRYDRLLLTTGAEPRRLAVAGRRARRRASTCAPSPTPTRCASGSTAAAAGRRRRRLDRRRGRRLRAAARPRRDGHRAGVGAARARARHGDRRRLRRDPRRSRRRMLMGTGVEAFEGDGAVERVRTSDGRVVDCDFVVVGVGVQPRTALAAEAGLAVSNGVLVDERLRANAPGVFAAGDVANAAHPFYGEPIRVEHWANALNQGAGRRPQHARPVGPLRSPAVLLLRPVRRRHGVLRLGPRLRPGRRPRRSRRARVRRLLDVRGSRHGGHERQRLGRDRPHQAPHRRADRRRRPQLADTDLPLDQLASATRRGVA